MLSGRMLNNRYSFVLYQPMDYPWLATTGSQQHCYVYILNEMGLFHDLLTDLQSSPLKNNRYFDWIDMYIYLPNSEKGKKCHQDIFTFLWLRILISIPESRYRIAHLGTLVFFIFSFFPVRGSTVALILTLIKFGCHIYGHH